MINFYYQLHEPGLGKKLDALAKKPNCQDIALWKPSIRNHLYWSAASTQDGDGEVMAAKFESLINHMQDIHVHENQRFPACLHGPLDPQDRGGKVWLNDGNINFHPC